jgi:hypothetical protein
MPEQMPKDNTLSTVLLLVALGFLIYYLTKPKTVGECFTQDAKSATPKSETPKSATPKSETPKSETPKSETPKSATPKSETPKSETPKSVTPKSETPKSETPKSEVVRSIVSESRRQDPKSRRQVPKSETPRSEVRGNQMDVFQFEPSDINQDGASLDAAFQRPIPQQARPDVVDINKNNVKKYNAKDFLPKEINKQWFDTDFSQAKFNINDDKLINTERYVIGINTVGQSLKNASYDIRGTVPNPKFTVSPWNNSTYEPDMNLRPLC